MALLEHRDHEDRPWGSFTRFTHDELSTVKLIYVAPGKRLSLQYHEKRGEFWRILTGSATVRIGDQEFAAQEGDEFEIPPQALHRITGGESGVSFLEISLGAFDENDIVRVEDDFGRTGST